MERTFVMVKPDGVNRGLVGRIVSRFEDKGLKIAAVKMLWMDEETASKHYAEHNGKPFYEKLVSFITSGPVVAMVLQGKDAVAVARSMMGATSPSAAGPGTIRGDYGLETGRNIVHGSDSLDSAKREIQLFFDPTELIDYTREEEKWLYE